MSISGFKVDGQTHKYLYSALENAPSIPTKVSDLANDSEYYTKPSSGIPASDLTSGIQTNLESLNVNLIPYPYHRTTSTINGISFTDNGDGTITADGTATSNATFVMHGWTIADGSIPVDPSITYQITGSPEGSTASTYFVACRFYASDQTPSSTGGTLRRDYGNGLTFTGATHVSIYIAVIKNQTVTNLVFRPMMSYAGLTDTGFIEYGKSLIPYLTETIETLTNQAPFTKTVTFSASGTQSISDSRFTADHHLIAVRFFDSNNTVTSETLADFTYEAGNGSCSITITTVHSTGSMQLTFTYAP